MKNIKIYLQYPWKFPDSAYYKYLIENPPSDVEFVNRGVEGGAITKRLKFKFLFVVKDIVRNLPQKFGLAIANAKTSPPGNYDLIHGCHCLIKNKETPWVMDVEMMGSFLVSGFSLPSRIKKVSAYLTRNNCKKILPWTNDLKKDILKDYPEIKNKVRVIYPAVPFYGKQRNISEAPCVIYIARAFQFKGGIFALETLRLLREKHNIRAIVISSVPKELKKRYPTLEIYDLLPQDKMFGLLKNADVFLYPSQLDTFGFSILEAMSFGVPTVALNTPMNRSINEIIDNNKDGFLVNCNLPYFAKSIGDREETYVKQLYHKCEKLIINQKLRKKMSANCLNKIRTGKFSIKKRNKELDKVYCEALK